MRKTFIAIAVIGIVSGIVYWKEKSSVEHAIITSPVLKEHEKEKIIVNTRRGTITRTTRDSQGNQSTRVDTGIRDIAVTVDDKDKLYLTFPTKGFIFEPGLSIFGSQSGTYLGLDTQLFFWKRWGINIGSGTDFGSRTRYRVYVSGSCVLPFEFLSNTSVFVGIDTSKDILVGVRVRL